MILNADKHDAVKASIYEFFQVTQLNSPKLETEADEQLNTLNSQVSGLAIIQFLVLGLLVIYPTTQRWIALVLLRNVAVPVLFVVLFELQETLHPTARVADLPLEPNGFKHTSPILGKLTLFSLFVKLQLTTLEGHPCVQLRRLRVVGRNPCGVVPLLKVHQLGVTITPELVTLFPGPFEV